MLSITTKSPYALSALVELHRQGGAGPVPIAELARRREIPCQFLEQLFATLRRAGVLRSQRGVKGGYSLARPAEEITGVFGVAAQAAAATLAQATVASVAEQELAAATTPMYYI
jgi:Rrf2 family cysteine metabolism transcriptional repressor